MIEMQRELMTDSAPDAVFAYLADFTTTEQWDPGTVRTVRIAGDGGVGSRYANTSRFAGRTSDLVYVVTGLTPGQSIELRGENASVIAHDTITVAAQPAYNVALPEPGAHDGCQLAQQLVADAVAKLVVHALEIVHVENQQAAGIVALAERALDLFLGGRAVE